MPACLGNTKFFLSFLPKILDQLSGIVSADIWWNHHANPIQSNPIQSDLNTMKMSVFENTYCKHSYVNIKKLKKQCTSSAQTINNVTQTILCSKCLYQFCLLRRFNLVDIKTKVNYAGIYSFTRRQLRLRNIVTKHLVRIIMKSFKLKIRVI